MQPVDRLGENPRVVDGGLGTVLNTHGRSPYA
jgi:hypothetical protein